MSIVTKSVIKISITSLLAVFLVLMLFVFSSKPANSGFVRKFYKDKQASLVVFQKKEENLLAISGVSKESIYFQTLDPGKIYTTDRNLSTKHYLKIDSLYKFRITRFDCLVDSSKALVFAGNERALFKYDLRSKKFETIKLPLPLFTRSLLISDNSLVLRSFDGMDQIFMKFTFQNGQTIKENGISARNNDGGIPTDGLLHFDTANKRLVYVHFYDNSFICLDSNLNKVYQGHTIDTINYNRMKVGKIGSDKDYDISNASPATIINWDNCVSDGFLYNKSMVRGDNDASSFANSTTIDVYNLKNGAYERSFYVPDFKDEKIQRFKVHGNELIAIYKDFIVIYQIPKQ